MKRLTAALSTALVLAAAALLLTGGRAESSDTYQVNAIFDTAKGIIPGQLVKIAGARVGSITDVQLTKDYKARIVMDVPSRFQFTNNASCNIQPEGLISENFVQCDPGTPGKPKLEVSGDTNVPTVPVDRTSVPISITDLFKIFQADIRQRFTVILAALGAGVAARGPELNEILIRSNPTLQAVRRLTSDLAAQKETLRAAVSDTDAVIAQLAKRSDNLTEFIDESNRLSRQSADHSSALAEAIHRLPGLLDQTDVVLGDLNTLTTVGRPLLGELRAATPGIERVVDQLTPFSKAALPVLGDLSETSDIGRATVKASIPVVHTLRKFAADALPTGRLLNSLLVNLRQRGFVENLNLFGYYAAAALSRYDQTSHIFPAHAVISTCSTYAMTPVAGCNAFFGPGRAGRTAPVEKTKSAKRGAADATPTPAPGATGDAPATGGAQVPSVLAPVQELADQLAAGVGKALPPDLQALLNGQGSTDNQQALDDLTEYLFKP
jgi:virulence factor Mce-like protein